MNFNQSLDSDRDLVAGVLAGQTRSVARLIRLVEDEPQAARSFLKKIFPHTGRAWVVGLTGSPGVGKSTLTEALIRLFRSQGLKVGVLAVDPTSPFSGGALLGDRIRMQAHAVDPGVFIRSLATRGAFGGLSAAVRGAAQVLDAAGFDRVLVETVGVGQDEVDVVRLVHTTVVITVPGLGDEVQAIKAGIMEIADLLVVNKADLPGADETVHGLKNMLDLNRLSGQKRPWWPPVIPVSARTAQGLDDLMAGLASHESFLRHERPDLLAAKTKAQVRELILDLVKEAAVARALAFLEHQPAWEEKFSAALDSRSDPYTLAEEILSAWE